MSLTSQYPHIEDIVAYRGDDWQLGFEREYFDSTGSLGMLQTVGWTAAMHVRDEKDAPTARLSATVITGQSDSLFTNGRIVASIAAAAMATMPDGYIGYYDLQTIDTLGTVKTWATGRFIVNGDITDV